MTFILQKGIEEMSDLSQVRDTFLIVILQILLALHTPSPTLQRKQTST